MEITGKIIAVLPAVGGQSQRTGNAWKKQEYVIETHDQFPRKCCFTVFGEDKINQFNIQAGEELTVSFDIDARQWQNRWFNDIRAWAVSRNVQPVSAPASQPVNDMPFPPTQAAGQEANAGGFVSESDSVSGGSTDDLPF